MPFERSVAMTMKVPEMGRSRLGFPARRQSVGISKRVDGRLGKRCNPIVGRDLAPDHQRNEGSAFAAAIELYSAA